MAEYFVYVTRTERANYRYRVTDEAPLGTTPESAAQTIDAARARSALTQATEVAGARTGRSGPRPVEHRSLGRSL